MPTWPQFRHWLRPPIVVLAYHRVAELSSDPWRLAVSPSHFQQQMDILRAEFTPISLADLSAPSIRRRQIAVTFDDGYADNLRVALPILQRHRIPATFFLTFGEIGQSREFWWDALERLVFEHQPLERWIEIESRSGTTSFDTELKSISRYDLYQSLWQSLFQISTSSRQQNLDRLYQVHHLSTAARPTHEILNWNEVRELADASYTLIGAHSMTHSPLAHLSPEEQAWEIDTSKEELMRFAPSLDSMYFAYPHGHHSDATRALVAKAGFRMAFTTQAGLKHVPHDAMQVPRCTVQDWDGAAFRRQLNRWFAGQF